MQQRLLTKLRRPVRRQGAEQYVLVTLLSFGASVTLTRLFLAMTGYPQLGGGELHIAHALWGGLLLYIASLLPLILANRWVYMAAAVLAGLGVGLFIDEVGKFITKSNDYFYPLAAPIVYGFFLLSTLLYLRVRRPFSRNVRAELYRVFDAMEEVLEQDLDPQERDALEARLRYVAENSDRPDLARLAIDLTEFLRNESVKLAPRRPGMIERAVSRWKAFEQSQVTRLRAKAVLAGGLLGLGLFTMGRSGLALAVVSLALAAATPDITLAESTRIVLQELGRSPGPALVGGLFRYTNLALETAVGLLLILSAGLVVIGREHLGTAFGSLGLLLSLTAVNLLVFYYDQFASILIALMQLGMLLATAYYRQRYVEPPLAPAPSPPPGREAGAAAGATLSSD